MPVASSMKLTVGIFLMHCFRNPMLALTADFRAFGVHLFGCSGLDIDLLITHDIDEAGAVEDIDRVLSAEGDRPGEAALGDAVVQKLVPEQRPVRSEPFKQDFGHAPVGLDAVIQIVLDGLVTPRRQAPFPASFNCCMGRGHDEVHV